MTYPISTFSFGKTDINYTMFFDHDMYQGSMGDFKIFDHTNYPNTLDPTREYTKQDDLKS